MQQQHSTFPVSGAIDVGEVLAGIWSRKAMVLIMFLLAVGASVGFVSISTPKYRATAKVLVENLETAFTKTSGTSADQITRIEERDVLSQVEVASSPDLAREVLLSLDDKSQASFTRVKPAGLIDRLMFAAGFDQDPRSLSPEQRALGRFARNTSVYAVPRSKVIVMRYSSSRPERAALIVNRLAEKYVEATRNAQQATTNRAQDWLAGQIDILRRQVVDSEVAVEQFRAEAGLLKGTTTTLNSQELSELNSQIILASAAKAEALAKASSIRELLAQTGTVDASTDVLGSPLIQRLREQQVRVRRSLAELSTIYLDNHPRIKAVRTELQDLDRQVRAEALKIVNGLEQQAQIAATREATLRQSLDQLKVRATDTGVDEVKLRSLEREAAANRQLLESFLSRYSDAASRVRPEAQPGLARIIETATVPSSPYFPKKGPVIVLSGIGGLVLGIGLAFLLEVMAAAGRMHAAAQAVHSHAPLQQVAAVSPLPPQRQAGPPSTTSAGDGAVPLASAGLPDATKNPRTGTDATPISVPATAPPIGAPRTTATPQSAAVTLCTVPFSRDAHAAAQLAQTVIGEPGSQYAQAIRSIASWAIRLRQTMDVSHIACVPFADCALDTAAVSVGLARGLAGQGCRVILLDASDDAGHINQVAMLDPGPGVSELLAGQATFSDVIVRDHVSPAHIIGSGLGPYLAQPGKMKPVLDALDHAYDIILVHNGSTRFPAVQDHSALTFCDAGFVVATAANNGEANALCGALTRASWKAAQTIAVSTPHVQQPEAKVPQDIAAAL